MKVKKGNKKYYEILKNMSGEKRMKIGFEMYDFALKIVESSIRNQEPGISENELKQKIKERLPK
ncbi:hypothetical protein KAW65_02740 [candidate division WOR-3 bacterium]|nr:hypothetical protein [candidate division WOR-3 bacterium]